MSLMKSGGCYDLLNLFCKDSGLSIDSRCPSETRSRRISKVSVMEIEMHVMISSHNPQVFGADLPISGSIFEGLDHVGL